MKFLERFSIRPGQFLYVLPVFFLITTIIIHFSLGPFYQLTVDPEYFHMLNGMNLAVFNLATPYTAHPGTPIQVAFALASIPLNIILPDGVIEDAINHPELFIHATSILITMILTGLLLWFGKVVYGITQSLPAALLVQLIPYSSTHQFLAWGRVMPETFMAIPLIILMGYSLQYIHKTKNEETNIKHVRFFAMIVALSLATKFSFFPFLIIPLILLPSKKFKFQFLGYSLIFTLLFAFPVLFNFSESFKWFSKMLISSGKWGGGSSTFIDLSSIPQRLNMIIQYDISFNYIIIISLAVCGLVFLFGKKIHQPEIFRKSMLLLSFTLAIVVFIVLVLKHFSIHYLIPLLIFKLFFIYLLADIIKLLFGRSKFSKWWYALALIVGLFFAVSTIIHTQHAIPSRLSYVERQGKKALQVNQSIHDDMPVIITSYYWGSPFPEKALVDGFLLAGHLKYTFDDYLIERFPKSYFYYNWTDKFYYWDKFKSPKDFIEPRKGVYAYIVEKQEFGLDKILNRIQDDFPDFEIQTELLLDFKNPKEQLYHIHLHEKNNKQQ